PDCCGTLEFTTLNCNPDSCLISDIVVEPLGCDTVAGTFNAAVTFNAEGLTNDFVEIWIDEEYYGFYPWDSLPIIVENIPGDGTGSLITICENDNPDCCVTDEFLTPDCGGEACAIFDIVIDATDCDSNGMFGAFINFESQGLTNDFVDVWINEVFIGFFPADTFPVFVEGIPGTGETVLVTICANDNPDCCGTIEFTAPDCGVGDCNISELVVEPIECDTSTGTFSAAITFDAQNLNNDFVEIWIDEVYYGFYPWDSLPILVDGIPGDGTGSFITVCANDNPDCCASAEFLTPDCGGATCGIFEVAVDPVECTSDSTFNAWLNFETTGFTNNSVDIWAGDGGDSPAWSRQRAAYEPPP
ncbi:MAG: hypothetical protein R3330_18750, partial [Saprospiraceae bacterium]|nr:hypothetical protein [Saprospiraceae bacterium]